MYTHEEMEIKVNTLIGDVTKKLSETNVRLVANYNRKYVKLIIQRSYDNCNTFKDSSVWGFIVNIHDDKQFQYGDLLKASGWSAPARNKARGNIFNGTARYTQYGPEYL